MKCTVMRQNTKCVVERWRYSLIKSKMKTNIREENAFYVCLAWLNQTFVGEVMK